MYVAKRSEENPLIQPNKDHYWEEFATFNMCPVEKGDTIYGLYRAISAEDKISKPSQMSVVGIAESKDGIHFTKRSLFIEPKEEWEAYGCEDPRVTFFEGKYYIFYTALSIYPYQADGIKIAVAVSDDLTQINERHFVTPFNAKAMTLFPERINGKIVVAFSAFTDTLNSKTVYAYLDHIEELWSPVFWEGWLVSIDEHVFNMKRNEHDHVEIGAPPVKTKDGWLLVYSHIQNYFPTPENFPVVFGIEALLLDLENPKKIIGRTKGPLLVPEELYEVSGYVSNVVFPSGALINGDTLTVYYGAADTTSCAFHVNLTDLIGTMKPEPDNKFTFQRYPGNPILSPNPDNAWEALAVFNPAAIQIGDMTHVFYRAMSLDNTSTIGYFNSKNGYDINEKLDFPVYEPREDFEIKKIKNGNSGCEDPRLTIIEGRVYMCYTAYDSIGPPRVAVTSISKEDLVAQKWEWEKPFLITPRDLDDKDTCLIEDRFEKGYFILHRVNNQICGDYIDSLEPDRAMVHKCIRIMGPREHGWDSSKVGIAGPPIKTIHGWLLIYHGVSKTHNTYRAGAVLLDLKDPAIVLARSSDPVFEPVENYEKIGIVNNVVFPCGAAVRDETLFIYYGGADKVVGVATMNLEILLQALLNGTKY